MISSDRHFRKICKNYEDVENYNIATFGNWEWVLHHKMETHLRNGRLRKRFLSRKELKERGIYFDCNPNELIFMKNEEHSRLHKKGIKVKYKTKKKLSMVKKGRKMSKEQKEKLSKINKGKTLSEEHKRKIGERSKERWRNEKFREKIKKAMKMAEHKKGSGRKKISEEEKERRSQASKEMWADDEKRKKIITAMKGKRHKWTEKSEEEKIEMLVKRRMTELKNRGWSEEFINREREYMLKELLSKSKSEK